MSDLLPFNRLALICLPAFGGEGAPARQVLGRWLGEWQADHAVDCGCSALFILGGGGGAEAIAVRQAAEQQGLKVREIATPHALAGAVAPGELLLVIQPQVLPSSLAWAEGTDHRGLVSVFPSAPGVEAGFERIDLGRAWAGVMLVPGHAVNRLLELPEDVEAAPALLRIALQAGVPDRRLPEAMIASGDWPLLGRGVPVHLHEEKWLLRRFAAEVGEGGGLTTRLCHWALRRWGASLPGQPAAIPAALGAGVVLTAGAVAAAWYGLGAAGFALLALAALALEAAGAVASLQRGRERFRRRLPLLRRVIDAGLLACGYLGVEGRWFRQAFPALVLVLGLNLPAAKDAKGWQAALGDRAPVAAVLAGLALVTSPEVAMMLVSTLLLVARIWPHRG
ncbi:hypothetical protein [Alteraurantiacibacter buctensis]|uniref:Uncharacterized protein n=1 Tax=Alteraurantiacibacter buctensis TaxID=1503981 RepID=A0A844Z311_9SPHN|nr:hypothetical protein [Alteraurantiacibacter buctensis]MXO72273.1 hypothetical protein [Alteraurantiacibacter buctensis]